MSTQTGDAGAATGTRTDFTYDQNSHLLTHTDRNGTQFRYTYDNMGRVTQVQAWRGSVLQTTRSYSFFHTGALNWKSAGTSQLSFEYDAQGRVRRKLDNHGNINSYVYNTANNITQFTTTVNGATHVSETIDYDLAQRPRRILSSGSVLVTFTYDANGNRTSAVYNNGTRTDYTFNLANQVTSIINRRGTVVLSRFDYTYFMNGNVHEIIESYQNTSLCRTIIHTYDAAGRLSQERVIGSGAQTRTFTYDRRGNRTRMAVTGSSANYTVTYAYDLNNRLLTETRTGSGARTTQFVYDNNGNLTRVTTGSTVETRTYNAFNQLTRVSRPGMTADYAYRADGLRDWRSVNGHRISHVWNNGQIVLERNAQGQVINRYYIALVVNHRIRSRHHGWYLTNARGDVVQRTNDSGNVTQTYRYDAFGNAVWPPGMEDYQNPTANTNPFRIKGEYWDWERSEVYLRNRSYNPRKGRFTQPDPFWNTSNMQDSPLAILQAANLFVYVMNNPIRWIDPLGLFAWNEADDHWFGLRYEVEKAGGNVWWAGETNTAWAHVFGVTVWFQVGTPGVVNRGGTVSVRADTFCSTIVAARGAMTFLGGHEANLPGFSDYHMHVAIFAAPGTDVYSRLRDEDAYSTRWGLRYGFISGGMGFPFRTVGQINADTYMTRADRQFFHHLSSGVGTAVALFAGHDYFMRNHRRTFAYSGLWTNSTSFTIGLVNAMGLNHGLSSAQIANSRGINNAFAPRYFGRR